MKIIAMKCYVLFSLLFISTLVTKAQNVKPVYFYGDKVITDADRATSYGVVGKLSTEDIYVLKRYDLDDNLLMTGSYKDEQLTIPHGKFTFYQDVDQFNLSNNTFFKANGNTRFIAQLGSFVDGLEQGLWMFYYPDGKAAQIANYKSGKLEGEFIVIDKKNKTQIKGQYKEGLKTGNWYLLNKKKLSIYENDKLVSSKKLSKEEILNIE